MVIAMVTMVAVTATAFFSDVLDIVACGILEVVLGCFKLVRTVCSVCSESAYSSGVHCER